MINSKKKGNRFENKLAAWLTSHGITSYKDSASGGGSREKGDIINNHNLTIESKAAKNIKLMEWWRQVEKSSSIHHTSPVLFIHQDGMSEDTWLVTMHSEDWAELLIHPLIATQKPLGREYNQKMMWAMSKIKQGVKELLNAVEEES